MGDRDAARADAERSLEAARRSKNPTATASAQFARAVALAHDDPVAAARALDESIEVGRRGTSGGLLGFALARRSVLRADVGDFAGARRDAREAVKHGHERGDRPMLSSALECSVAVLHAMGRDEAAAVLAGGLLAGVASGMPRSVTGGLVADLGVADALEESRAALGEDEYLDRARTRRRALARRDRGLRVQRARRRRARSSVTATGTRVSRITAFGDHADHRFRGGGGLLEPEETRGCATGSRRPASRPRSRRRVAAAGSSSAR